jgi:hypothetical protein
MMTQHRQRQDANRPNGIGYNLFLGRGFGSLLNDLLDDLSLLY